MASGYIEEEEHDNAMINLRSNSNVVQTLFRAAGPFSLEVRLLLPPAAFIRSQSDVLFQHKHYLVNCGLYFIQAAVLMA